MIKKIVIAMVLVFSMVSISVSAPTNYGIEYIKCPAEGVITINLIDVPSYSTWGMWDIGLYDFVIGTDGSIVLEGMVDLFCDIGSEHEGEADVYEIDLTFGHGWVSNGRGPNTEDSNNRFEMTGHHLGVMFEYGDDDNCSIWYSHATLNGGTDNFDILPAIIPPLEVVRWYNRPQDDTNMVGSLLIYNPVPIPGSFYLMFSGIGVLFLLRRKGK